MSEFCVGSEIRVLLGKEKIGVVCYELEMVKRK